MDANSFRQRTSYFSGVLVGIVLMLALTSSVLWSGVSRAQDATPIIDATPAMASTPVAASVCDTVAPGVGSEAWIQTDLYFGTTMPDGSRMTDDAWQKFLDTEVTPRFPDGLTVLQGYGQFLDSQGVIRSEDSIVLVILRPYDDGTASVLIDEIREAYKTQFDQESVLRVDQPGACVSF